MGEVVLAPLGVVLSAVPDPRGARGERHPLSAASLLACVAMLRRCDRLLAIAEWGRDRGADVAARLGFRRARTPRVATLRRVFRRLDVAASERVVGRWAEGVLAALGAGAPLPALAVDGETLRGSHLPAVPAAHPLG